MLAVGIQCIASSSSSSGSEPDPERVTSASQELTEPLAHAHQTESGEPESTSIEPAQDSSSANEPASEPSPYKGKGNADRLVGTGRTGRETLLGERDRGSHLLDDVDRGRELERGSTRGRETHRPLDTPGIDGDGHGDEDRHSEKEDRHGDEDRDSLDSLLMDLDNLDCSETSSDSGSWLLCRWFSHGISVVKGFLMSFPRQLKESQLFSGLDSPGIYWMKQDIAISQSYYNYTVNHSTVISNVAYRHFTLACGFTIGTVSRVYAQLQYLKLQHWLHIDTDGRDISADIIDIGGGCGVPFLQNGSSGWVDDSWPLSVPMVVLLCCGIWSVSRPKTKSFVQSSDNGGKSDDEVRE